MEYKMAYLVLFSMICYAFSETRSMIQQFGVEVRDFMMEMSYKIVQNLHKRRSAITVPILSMVPFILSFDLKS